MSIKMGVVMDPIQEINLKKDTTLAMLLAAQAHGHEIHYMRLGDLMVVDGAPVAMSKTLKLAENPLSTEQWFTLDNSEVIALEDLDYILMRKDPPFNMDYIYATYILEKAEKKGTLVVNKPQSLRDCNEKLFATEFPECCPPTIVTCNISRINTFIETHKTIIIKPLDGMGGASIFKLTLDDPNKNMICQHMTDDEQRLVMLQKFIPEIKDGDKRILIIDGKPIPYALARIPAKGETRGNLAAGGTGVGQPLSDRDLWICDKIAPTLKQKGLIFVGIDVIGDYLTEINVTSPTCIQELDKAFNLNIANDLILVIEKKLKMSAKQ